ncbi:PhzF family phenazine biosynthesis protein [Aureimonas altamirensis]|uniref:PhzF family phenazine biosynthesis protein n=1 Tax=Aureimonas altamirensis TaxID=370622 RepID=UPI001E43945A|nr:PhzF family phenazine biosynthesis protein [Aureimonas altamirensis]UHD45779.1 PhzF family phenazine biosynthesis protein [Aureimonas altamirensis]
MRQRRFMLVDVFASKRAKGNGLAVVFDADDLTDIEMQQFAAWTSMAETTFFLRPTIPNADYRVRIFTPGREMPFAGHPTLGSCAAWLRAGGQPTTPGIVRQECRIGIVEIDMTGSVPGFVAPPTKAALLPDADVDRLCSALDLDRSKIMHAVRLDNGPVWQLLELESAEAVLAIDSTRVQWPEYVGVSLFGPHPEGSDCDYEVRNVSPASGMSEDPVTGSLNAAIAMWMSDEGRLGSDLIMAQGTQIGREGRVFIRRDIRTARVIVGGHAHVLVDGKLEL